MKIVNKLLVVFSLVMSLAFVSRAADATNAAAATAAATNAVASATTNAAPAGPVADPLGYPPGLNAGNEQDLQWPVPAATLANLAMTNAPTPLYAKPTMDELIQNVAHNKVSINVVWTLVRDTW